MERSFTGIRHWRAAGLSKSFFSTPVPCAAEGKWMLTQPSEQPCVPACYHHPLVLAVTSVFVPDEMAISLGQGA